MAHAKTHTNGKSARMPEMLREPLLVAQARIGELEDDAKRLLEDLMARGRASKRDLEQLLHRLSKQDWSLPEVKHRVEKLQAQGLERAAEWRGKAEAFRVEALERVMDVQSRAVQFLGAASREQVDELSKELDRLARRLDRAEKGRRNRKAKPSEV